MSCFPSGLLPPRDPIVLDASGRAVNAPTLHIGIAATEALLRGNRTMFAPGQLVTLTDDPLRADVSLAWKFKEGRLDSLSGFSWFTDPEQK